MWKNIEPYVLWAILGGIVAIGLRWIIEQQDTAAGIWVVAGALIGLGVAFLARNR